MVVMEPGGEWPGSIDDETNVVALGQSGDDLLRRTEEKIGALQRGKHGVRVAVLACNAAADDAAFDRRSQLARMLLGAVAGTACGLLVLSARGHASDQLRRELLLLAGELTGELHGKTASISLRFT